MNSGLSADGIYSSMPTPDGTDFKEYGLGDETEESTWDDGADTEMHFHAQAEDKDKRLDKFLSEKLPDLSRSFIQKQLKDGNVEVNGKKGKSGRKLKSGEEISFFLAPIQEIDVLPQDIQLDIIYEDDDIIVINKPKQMVVHPAPGHPDGTLVNALLYHCKDSLSGINGFLRPGIVHRIDMDTTGALVACKNDFSHKSIAIQLKEHSITRTYHAIVHGNLPEKTGTVKGMIGRNPADRKKMAVTQTVGKSAVTHYKVLDELNHNYNYIACNLETGRTHQIRVHMASIGHPVLGDKLYGPKKCPFNLTGQTLHAKTLGFIHPRTGKYMEFNAPLPDYFVKLLGNINYK